MCIFLYIYTKIFLYLDILDLEILKNCNSIFIYFVIYFDIYFDIYYEICKINVKRHKKLIF